MGKPIREWIRAHRVTPLHALQPKDADRIQAKDIFTALGGNRVHNDFLCHCPVPSHGKGNGDPHPSLSVRDGDGGLLLHCFGGCAPSAIRAELERRELIPPAINSPVFAPPPSPKSTTEDALRLWRASRALPGTHGATYVAGKGLPVDLPILRFLPHYSCGRRAYPAIIAALQKCDREISSIQITLLDARQPVKARLPKPRLILGPSKGCALRLAPAAETLGLAADYETGHAAMMRYGIPTWCGLDALRLPYVVVPPIVRRIVVFAAPDNMSQIGARSTIFMHSNREVIIHNSPDHRSFSRLWQDDPRSIRLLLPPLG